MQCGDRKIIWVNRVMLLIRRLSFQCRGWLLRKTIFRPSKRKQICHKSREKFSRTFARAHAVIPSEIYCASTVLWGNNFVINTNVLRSLPAFPWDFYSSILLIDEKFLSTTASWRTCCSITCAISQSIDRNGSFFASSLSSEYDLKWRVWWIVALNS